MAEHAYELTNPAADLQVPILDQTVDLRLGHVFLSVYIPLTNST